ncbi:gliding motility-associated ABC transporter substrate-binding protein GldG [Christiangramia flava]|uniref:Gliding motility protein GldG n=1 Tax=Christiangramia flava JLT2011 TaxID=1229726 RepID=A0A1L7HZG5_9FLAO|nr:gliding motility protein GldG [Christiangramia flava JLT2011]OSS38376.1 gliding motility protein GldG [Christiangramia flava JLT2011]
MMSTKSSRSLIILLVALIALNWISGKFYTRLDLTEDQRYSLSPASERILEDVDSPIIFDVFLQGSFPSEFRRLQSETRQMLEEFAAHNRNIVFNFVDPLENGQDANIVAQEFMQMGMTPARVNVRENGKNSESIVFPWAIANYGQKTVTIPLMKNQIGSTDEERVTASVQQLEYVLADGISKLVYPRKKKIAIMRGNGELPDANIADFVKTLQQYYYTAPFTLDSVAKVPQRTLKELEQYDLVIEPKPTQAYSEKEKLVLDQYLMHGGKMIWLAEMTNMESDSLMNASGTAIAIPKDLNLGDYFFSYGIRINPELVKDLYSAPIILASGEGSETRFNPYPWFYSPLTTSPNQHPIINNLEAVKFEYANPIDTLKNGIHKTVLLTSSPRTEVQGTPLQISLDLVNEKPDLTAFNSGEQNLAVLLEGQFPSVYKNRIKPFELDDVKDQSSDTKMLVISDGDVIKNDLQRGRPVELGFDRFTGNSYGNKEFLLNAVNYMLDDNGLIDIRSKEVRIAFLDSEKLEAERTTWQLINLAAPLVILALFGLGFHYYRRRKYIK